jgi:orotidine 5'-phosphate decarboxylase subfamily 2
MKNILSKLTASNSHPFIVGFDPDWAHLPPPLTASFSNDHPQKLIIDWAGHVFDALSSQTKIVKVQSAYFEAFGYQGWQALEEVIKIAKQHKLFVVLDAKRGDIDSTMRAYGKAAFERLNADALTITPWMGVDILKALLPWFKNGKGVYTVWLSSNESGRHVQEQLLASGLTMSQKLFSDFQIWSITNGVENSLGYVLGATHIPSWLKHTELKNQCLLMPGVGAQGAKIDNELKKIIENNPGSTLPISRGVLVPNPSVAITSWSEYQSTIKQQFQSYIQEWQMCQ